MSERPVIIGSEVSEPVMAGPLLHSPGGKIVMPQTMVAGAAAEQLARETIAEWKIARPKDYAEWPAVCAERRKEQIRNGWTAEKHMKLQIILPTYVLLIMGRKLGDHDWHIHDERALHALVSLMPCCKMDPHIGTTPNNGYLCDGDYLK